MARKARRSFAAGRDPIAKRATAPQTMSFGDFAADLIDDIEGGFENEKHRKQWRSTLATYAATLSDKPIDQICTDDLVKILQPIWLKIPETASRLRSRIERILDAANAL